MSTKESNTDDWGDKPIPEDAAIKAAHPIRTKRHDLYEEAQRMVGAKRGKFALVELVNWLLHRVDAATWKPAKGAPKYRVLLVKMADGAIGVAHRDDDSAWWDCHVERAGRVSYFSTRVIDEPTHYRELPVASEGGK